MMNLNLVSITLFSPNQIWIWMSCDRSRWHLDCECTMCSIIYFYH